MKKKNKDEKPKPNTRRHDETFWNSKSRNPWTKKRSGNKH